MLSCIIFTDRRILHMIFCWCVTLSYCLVKQTCRDESKSSSYAEMKSQSCVILMVSQLHPPHERKVHHILLLGQGGSGNKHVMQNLVFDAVLFIWPPLSADEPTLHVVLLPTRSLRCASMEKDWLRIWANSAVRRFLVFVHPCECSVYTF